MCNKANEAAGLGRPLKIELADCKALAHNQKLGCAVKSINCRVDRLLKRSNTVSEPSGQRPSPNSSPRGRKSC